MKAIIVLLALTLIVVVSAGADSVWVDPYADPPLLTNCEIDLDGDGEDDVAVFAETAQGRELIVLFKTDTGYDAHVVTVDDFSWQMECVVCDSVVDPMAGPQGKPVPKVYETPGAYLQLFLYESCSEVAYFWNGEEFTEVFTHGGHY